MTRLEATRPIFLFSLPRSGSTLLQRVVSTHPDVATASEPWILLPLLYSSRSERVIAEYDHSSAARAIIEFARDTLPGGMNDYRSELAAAATRIYTGAARGKPYFLDKTPRYHLVAKDIVELFPESPTIFLWRNPLSIAASMIETWGHGQWILDACAVDLFDGLANLTDVYANEGNRAITVRYEDLVLDPSSTMRRLFHEIGIQDHPQAVHDFDAVRLTGTMGDSSGVERYKRISPQSLTQWQRAFDNPIRKAWARRYLRWIGKQRLELMGYSLEVLETELAASRDGYRNVVSDVARYAYSETSSTLARALLRRSRGNAVYRTRSWRYPSATEVLRGGRQRSVKRPRRDP